MLIKLKKWMVLVPILLGVYFSWLNRYFFFDDALIYARYIENFLNGDGLVYNAGEYFNGLTSPFFTYLSIVTSYIIGDVIFSINLLSGLFLILSIIMIEKNFTTDTNRYYVLFGLLLVVSLPFLYYVFGMETFIFIFFQKNYFLLFIVLTLLILTRSEGIFLVLALAIEHFRLKNKIPPLKYFILPIVILIVHFSFNFNYYGAFLPETGSAKIWQGMSGLWGVEKPIFITGSKHIIDWVFSGNRIVLFELLFLSLFGIYKLGKNSLNFIILIFLILLLAFYSFLNIPNYHWYDTPFIIFLFIYSALGLQQLHYILNKLFCKKNLSILLVLILILYPLINNFKNLHFGRPNHPYIKIGNWLKSNTKENDSIAMVEIGIVGYYSKRKIINILGLVNHYNAKFIGEKNFSKWLTRYRPEYILVHSPLWVQEQGVLDVLKNGDYLEWKNFNFKGYKLLARSDMKIEKNQLTNPYFYDNIYEKIIKDNLKIDKSFFNITDYTVENKYSRILFAHVGITFKVSEQIIKGLSINNKLTFGIGIMDDAYLGANKSEGACFEIYKNNVNLENKIFQKCINPIDNEKERGILSYTLNLEDISSEYIFRVTKREQKSESWGWSFFTFDVKGTNESI